MVVEVVPRRFACGEQPAPTGHLEAHLSSGLRPVNAGKLEGLPATGAANYLTVNVEATQHRDLPVDSGLLRVARGSALKCSSRGDRPNTGPHQLHNMTSRERIQDHEHAVRIVQSIPFGDLFKDGGTQEGFADWLFVRRKTFNAASPLQQARVYLNAYRLAKKQGLDWDSRCHAEAIRKLDVANRARDQVNAHLARVAHWWTETPVGPDVFMALASFSLGRGHYFADSPDGAALPELPEPWVLEVLSDLLQAFSERSFRPEPNEKRLNRLLPQWNLGLQSVLNKVSAGEQELSEMELRCVTFALWELSRLPRVRTALHGFVVQAKMIEQIRDVQPAASFEHCSPARRRSRLV